MTMDGAFGRLEPSKARTELPKTQKRQLPRGNFRYTWRGRRRSCGLTLLFSAGGGGGTGRRKGLKITFPIWYRLASIGTKGLRLVVLQPWLLQAKQYSLQSPCSYAASLRPHSGPVTGVCPP